MRRSFGQLRLPGGAWLVAVLLAAALLGAALAWTALPGQSHSAAGSPGPFVALGDSFAAGDLIPASPSGSPPGCMRSSQLPGDRRLGGHADERGDDVGFTGVLETCVILSLTDLFGRPCQRH